MGVLSIKGLNPQALARVLARAPWEPIGYTVFSLQENAIGDDGASAVAGALKVNTTLTAL